MSEVSRKIGKCPVEVAMSHLGKKWTIHILRDMFRGKTKFSEFLHGINGISTKVLAQRLKDMEKEGLITKIITSKSPLSVNYYLTDRGLALQKLIIDLSMFAIHQFPDEVFATDDHDFELAEEEARRRFSTPVIDYSSGLS